jgi:hypothetical protein
MDHRRFAIVRSMAVALLTLSLWLDTPAESAELARARRRCCLQCVSGGGHAFILSLVTLPPFTFATPMFAPSCATPRGLAPTVGR